MKAYTSIREAVSDLKARTGHGYVSYFVNGTQGGFEIRAEKHDTRRISPDR